MKCVLCGATAVINMRRHKLRLCETHYPEWFRKQVAATIERYGMFGPEDRILVAVSGGKDSLTLWDVLLRLGYQADGLYINLGIENQGYSDESQRCAQSFAAEWPKVRLHVIDIAKEYGATVPTIARRRHRATKMCSVCGLIKRHVMNRAAYEGGYSVIATGHNLDDEVAVLFQNVLHWETGYLARQAPVLPFTHPKLARKVKPLVRMYERESAAYALVQGINFIEDECPYSVDAKSIFYKHLFNELESRSVGAKAQFYLQFIKAKRQGTITFADVPEEQLHECVKCGQPTTSPERCAFCRLLE